MAGKRSANKHLPKGRQHLAAATIGTETRIACPECGVMLEVAEGRGKLAGARVLKCGRLGCLHQEALPAAHEMALAGGSPLPDLDGGEDDAVSTTTASEAASGAAPPPPPAARTAATAGRSLRNGAGKRESRADRQARKERLMARAGDGATVPEDPAFGAPELAPTPVAITIDEPAIERALGAVAEIVITVPSDSRGTPNGPEAPLPTPASTTTETAGYLVPTVNLEPSALNPRQRFDEAALAELAESIREVGMLQPIVVRSRPSTGIPALRHPDTGEYLSGNTYWIVAGERRWRAARLAGLERVPVRRVHVDDAGHLKLALTENEARRDLDPIEQAKAYAKLRELTGQTQAEIGAAIGRDRATIANAIRLLGLPAPTLAAISEGKLGATHGRAILRYAEFPQVMERIGELAAERGTTAKELESVLPFTDELKKAKLIEQIRSWNAGFDTRVCKSCPFNAQFAGRYDRWCLKPAHMRQLKREHKAAERAAEEARRSALQATSAAAASNGGEGGEVSAPARLVLTALNYRDYEQVRRDGTAGPGYPEPSGCSTECPCARTADCGRHPEGQACKGKTICVDPKRFQELRRAEAAREEEARIEGRRRAFVMAEEASAAATVDDRRTLALLAAVVIVQQRSEREMIQEVGERAAPGLVLPPGDPYNWTNHTDLTGMLRSLDAMAPEVLLRLAVALASAREVNLHFGQYTVASKLLRWWLPEAAALRPGEPKPPEERAQDLTRQVDEILAARPPAGHAARPSVPVGAGAPAGE